MDGAERFTVLAVAIAAAGTLLVLMGFAGVGGGGDEPVPASFRLEDGSAACALLSPDQVVCRARGGDAAVVLEPDGGSRASDVELRWDDSTPVLRAAESWWAGDIRCRVAAGALSCARGGSAIFVDADGIGGIA